MEREPCAEKVRMGNVQEPHERLRWRVGIDLCGVVEVKGVSSVDRRYIQAMCQA